MIELYVALYIAVGLCASRAGWAMAAAPIPDRLPSDGVDALHQLRAQTWTEGRSGAFRIVAFVPALLFFVAFWPLFAVILLVAIVKEPASARRFAYMIVHARLPEK